MTMPSDATDPFAVEVVRGTLLPEPLRRDIISLCSRAYDEDLEPLLDSFVDASHVLGYCDGELASHALWVPRHLQAATAPIMRTAYLEALATDARYRRRGFAKSILAHVVGLIQDYALAALSPSDVEFYRRLGWELWSGPLFIRKDGALLPCADDEQVMIFRLPKTPALDLDAPLSAEWRAGELW